MPQPNPYTRLYNFTQWSTDYPTTPHAGLRVDAELNAIKRTLDDTLRNLAVIQRDDGAIANQSISLAQLHPSLLLAVRPPTVWVTGTAYVRFDIVYQGSMLYLCNTDHTAGVFATDLAATKWISILDYSDAILVAAQAAAEAAQAAAEAAQLAAEAAAADTAADVVLTAADVVAAQAIVDALSVAIIPGGVKTADFTASASATVYAVDTSAGPVICTLPPAPSVGDRIEWVDAKSTFGTNNFQLEPGAQKIRGATAGENLVIDVTDANGGAVYTGASYGWAVYR